MPDGFSFDQALVPADSAAHGNALDPGTTARAMAVYSGLMSRGMDHPTALGYAANAVQESRADPYTRPGDKGASHGTFMWAGPRYDRYVALHGHPPEQGDLDEHLDYLMWENQGPEADAWRKIQQTAPDPASRAAAISTHWERPKDTIPEEGRRSWIARQLIGSARAATPPRAIPAPFSFEDARSPPTPQGFSFEEAAAPVSGQVGAEQGTWDIEGAPGQSASASPWTAPEAPDESPPEDNSPAALAQRGAWRDFYTNPEPASPPDQTVSPVDEWGNPISVQAPAAAEQKSAPAMQPFGWSASEPDMRLPEQNYATGVLNAGNQALVTGTGAAISGAGEAYQAGQIRAGESVLRAMDQVDGGDVAGAMKPLTQIERGVLSQYIRAKPEDRERIKAAAQTEVEALAKRDPNMVARAGQEVTRFGLTEFPVSPANEGVGTQIAGTIGGVIPMVGAAIAGGAVAGPAGAIGAALPIIGAQSFHSTRQEALKAGASPAEAERDAGISALTQMGIMALPIGRVVRATPELAAPLAQAIVELGKRGAEFGTFAAVSKFADNFVAHETFDPKRELMEGVPEAAALGAASGAVMAVPGMVRGRAPRPVPEETFGVQPQPPVGLGGPAPEPAGGDGAPPIPPRPPREDYGQSNPRRPPAPTRAAEMANADERPKPGVTAAEVGPAVDVGPSDPAPEARPLALPAPAEPRVRGRGPGPGGEPIALGGPLEAAAAPEQASEPTPTKPKSSREDAEDASDMLVKKPLPQGWEIGVDPKAPKGWVVYDDKDNIVARGASAAEALSKGYEVAAPKTQSPTRPVDEAAARTVEPTPAQAEAGNYQKGHANVGGLDITIETPKGGVRRGVGPDGKPWEATLPAHYGYVKRTEGADGDHLDVSLGPHADAATDHPVFVVDQIDPKSKAFDEHKGFLGFASQADALAAYDGSFSDGSGPSRRGAVTEMPFGEFKEWATSGDLKKPLATPSTLNAPEIIEHTTAKGKTLRGVVRTDLSQAEARAIDPFTFYKKNKGWFIREKYVKDSLADASSEARSRLPSSKPNIQIMGGDADKMQGPQTEAIQGLWGKGNSGVPGVGKLPGVPAGHGSEADTQTSDRSQGQQQGILPGELPLGDVTSTTPEQKNKSSSNIQRQDNDIAGLGKGDRARSDDDHRQIEDGVERGKGSNSQTTPGSLYERRSRTNPTGTLVDRNEMGAGSGDRQGNVTGSPSAGVASGEGIADTRSAKGQIGDLDHQFADALAKNLSDPNYKPTARDLQALGQQVYGGTLGSGGFTRDRLYDAIELGVNRYIQQNPQRFTPTGDPEQAKATATELAALKDRIPTQTVRAGEKDTHQQFSTPPDYAYSAAWVANLRPSDHVLEPSAGTGGLIVHAMNAGVENTHVNELSDKRRSMLGALKPGTIHGEDATQLHNILSGAIKPTVVLMNPPFSVAAGRMGSKTVLGEGARHVEQALERLEPGGRLVAIVGRGMAPGTPTFRDWWKKIGEQYDVRANLGVEGDIYRKYGTTFPTRILVIDKAPPSGRKLIDGSVKTASEIIDALKGIRDERADQGGAVQPVASESTGVGVAPSGEGAGAANDLVPGSAGVVGPRSGRGNAPANTSKPAGSEQPGTGGELAPAARKSGSGPGDAVVSAKPEPKPGRTDVVPGGPTAAGDVTPGSSPTGVGSGVRSDGSGELNESGVAAPPELTVKTETAVSEPHNAELTDAVYETYTPQRVKIEGSKPHPGALVQSAAMASVQPPKTDYRPRIAPGLIKSGALSDAQLEAVVYAGHAHSQMLPAEGAEEPRRRGMFVGDGTGVGKGREIAGIILDNWNQGRKKAIWVSENLKLLNDARRDWSGMGRDPNEIISHQKTKAADPIKLDQGILFTGYDTLKSAEQLQTKTTAGKPAKGKTRVDQIVDWVGKDFDGVIAFDEAHNMANAIPMKGTRGTSKPSAKALAGVELQSRLPNARVVYISATGATEVSNLAYADRLGLWGRGTPFPNRNDFLSKINQGGIAGMELVARDMKALGHYIARNLSYDGVEYNRLEHKLSGDQRSTYDKLAEGWQVVLQNFEAAISETNGGKKARSAAMAQFWGTHQRFFNQIITSMQMPTVIKSVEKDIKEGRQAVLQLVNTMEAAQERAVEKAKQAGEDLEDLDMTPRDQLMQMIEKSFPVQQWEDYVDENGNEGKRPVVDAKGNPVLNRKAVAMREQLLDQLGSLRVPDGPLEILFNAFGVDKVAEVTGRGQRVVRKPDEAGQIKTVLEKRGADANISEANDFQDGKKPILVFSQAGGTGRSYHAAIGSGSEKMRRAHYLVQAGWRADKAVQGFGRTHRTNQASAPIFHLVTTDLDGQKRFISSIARRLGQLGALTKGERRTGDQGLFGLKDNLESGEARTALESFFKDLDAGKIPGLTIAEIERSTGLKLRNENGALEVPQMSQFLNRLLSFKVDEQNMVFREFADRLDTTIDRAAAAGTLDTGLETYKADRIEKKGDTVVYTDPNSGAETRHVQLEAKNRNRPASFETLMAGKHMTGGNKPRAFVQNRRSGRIYALTDAHTYTNKDGAVIDQYRLTSPLDYQFIDRTKVNKDNWDRVADEGRAKDLWDKQVAGTPEYRTSDIHLITGAVLPIWDRLGGSPKIFRLQTSDGERMLGRVIPDDLVDQTLESLGAEKLKVNATPAQIAARILDGGVAHLANGWTIKRSLVGGEQRLELVGPSFTYDAQLKNDGVFTERIDYRTRYFIPSGEQAPSVIERITSGRPVTQLTGGRTAGGASGKLYSLPAGWGAVESGLSDVPSVQAVQAAADAVSAMLGGNVHVAVVDGGIRINHGGRERGVGGYAIGRLIRVALDMHTLENLDHEAIHALRNLGALTPQEWALLESAARREGWIDKFGIGNEDRYGHLPEEKQIEEAIAEQFAKGAKGASSVSLLSRLGTKVRQWFERFRNLLARRGFKSADDVFRAIRRGEVGAREPGSGMLERGPRTVSESRDVAGSFNPDVQFSLLPVKVKETIKAVTALSKTVMERPTAIAARDTLVEFLAPMHLGTRETADFAFRFANKIRLGQYEFGQFAQNIRDGYRIPERWEMGRAQAEQSVFERKLARELTEVPEDQRAAMEATERQRFDATGLGHAGLSPDARYIVETLSAVADRTWNDLRDREMVDPEAEGWAHWMPRQLVVAEPGSKARRIVRDDNILPEPTRQRVAGAPDIHPFGTNMRTDATGFRDHEEVEETLRAARMKYGPNVHLVNDVLSLVGALERENKAIAGHDLLEGIKSYGAQTGTVTAYEGGQRPGFVVAGNPAMWRSRWVGTSEDGRPIFERVPVWVHEDFRGPIEAVFRAPSGRIMQGFMALKAVSTHFVMQSPLTHLQVELGRAMPLLAGRTPVVLTLGMGRRARLAHDPRIQELIRHGMAPIARGFIGDPVALMNEANYTPPFGSVGRSILEARDLIARGAARLPAGEVLEKIIRRPIQTLLWNRVLDLQVAIGLGMAQDRINAGWQPEAAYTAAAHLANRYAGALPPEGMSRLLNTLANVALFSRSFTGGNLGVMKDVFTGAPKHILDHIGAENGPEAQDAARKWLKGKGRWTFVADIILFWGATALLQEAAKAVYNSITGNESEEGIYESYARRFHNAVHYVETHPIKAMFVPNVISELLPTADNEPGKEDRIRLWPLSGSPQWVYFRTPLGKIGEEFLSWITDPFGTATRKQSTIIKGAQEAIGGKNGFGQDIRRPGEDEQAANIARSAVHFLESIFPTQLESDLYTAAGKPGASLWGSPPPTAKERQLAALQAAGSISGLGSFSRGHPGGPIAGTEALKERQIKFDVARIMPNVKRLADAGRADDALNILLKAGEDPKRAMRTVNSLMPNEGEFVDMGGAPKWAMKRMNRRGDQDTIDRSEVLRRNYNSPTSAPP